MGTASTEDDIEARQKRVVGDGPRIEAIPNDAIGPEISAVVNRTRAALGVGEVKVLPEYTRLIAKHPEIFRCHMEMGTAIFLGEIPAYERELAVLRTGWLCRAPFEWGEHVSIGHRVGIDPGKVEQVIAGPSAPGWNEHEAAIIRGVDELITDQAISDQTYSVLARSWSETQLIEYFMMVGHYVATALVQNSLRVRLADDNPGLSRR